MSGLRLPGFDRWKTTDPNDDPQRELYLESFWEGAYEKAKADYPDEDTDFWSEIADESQSNEAWRCRYD